MINFKSKISSSVAAVIVLTAAGLTMSLYLVGQNPNLTEDAVRYLVPIHQWVDGKGYTIFGKPHLHHPPGYGFLAYVIFLFCHDIVLSGMLVSALSYTLCIPLIYLIGRQYTSERWGLFAAGLFVMNPYFLSRSYLTFTECLFTLLLLVSLNLCRPLFRKDPCGLRCIRLGFCYGFAYLVRSEMIFIAVLVFALLFIRSMRHKKGRLAVLAGIAVLGLFVLPRVIYLHQHTGQWMFSAKTARGIYWGESVTDGDRHAQRLKMKNMAAPGPVEELDLVGYVRADPQKFLRRIVLNLKREIRIFGTVLSPLWFALIILGAGFWFLRKQGVHTKVGNLQDSGVFWIYLTPAAVYLMFYVNLRFMIPYSAVILLLIIRFMSKFFIQEGSKQLNWWLAVSLICSAIAVSGIYGNKSGRLSVRSVLSKKNDLREFWLPGAWFQQRGISLPGQTIYAPRGGDIILFKAGQESFELGRSASFDIYLSVPELFAEMNKKSVAFMILNPHVFYLQPQLKPLWENPRQAEIYGWRLLDDRTQDQGFQVYQPIERLNSSRQMSRPHENPVVKTAD